MNVYVNIEFSLSQDTVEHTRKAYALLDMFGEVGALFDFLITFFTFSVSVNSEKDFTIKILKKLFKVKCKDESLLKECVDGDGQAPGRRKIRVSFC